MSSSRPNPGERRVADQHLGDRLSALVDGELGHEARERVLAHLATCPKCKAEADAQRRLKNVFAEAAPPSPSESFLARLQGLPGGGDPGSGSSRLNGGGFGGGRLPGSAGRPEFPRDTGFFGVRVDPFGHVPAGPRTGVLPASEEHGLFGDPDPSGSGGSVLLGERHAVADRGLAADRGAPGDPGASGGRGTDDGGAPTAVRERSAGEGLDLGLGLTGERGFRIHRVGRPETERPASRGLRIALVATGAVSLAAIALGGVSTGSAVDSAEARGGSGSGSNVTPMRTAGTGTATGPESQRRRAAVGPLLGHGHQVLGSTAVAPTGVSAPLLPGIPAPAVRVPQAVRPPAAPLTAAPAAAGAAAASPLMHPLTALPPPAEPAWLAAPGPVAPGLMTPGLLATPLSTSSAFTSPTIP